MFECYEFEECEYNGQPKCCLPDDVDCPHGVKNHKPTNADRIRSMSDDELAEFLAEEQLRIANVVFQTVGYGLEKQAIYARRLDWLQQPAEEDT